MKKSPTPTNLAEIKFINNCLKAYNDFGSNAEVDNVSLVSGTSDFATSLMASNCHMLEERFVESYLKKVLEEVRRKVKVLKGGVKKK